MGAFLSARALRRRFLIGLLLLASALGALWFAAARMSVSALEEPGRIESYVASRAKHWVVARRARGTVAPAQDSTSVAVGGMQFRGSCASCHGIEGRVPTELGRAMYPRVPDLGSASVQQWSDAELFWVIKDGIRLSGMPGFGRTLSDEQIWPLVHYIRTLSSGTNSR